MEYTPYNANLILVTAHQDDESVVAGEVLRRRESGAVIGAAVATDGGASTEYHLDDTPPGDPEAFRRHLVQIRENEHIGALAFMGVSPENRSSSLLPDGELSYVEHFEEFAYDLARMALTFQAKYGPTAYITLGPEGFDGHADHIASHRAARVASEALATCGIRIPIFALNAAGEGIHTVPIGTAMKQKKMDILRFHRSQMKFHADGTPNTEFFDRMMTEYGYGAIFEAETYDLIPPE